MKSLAALVVLAFIGSAAAQSSAPYPFWSQQLPAASRFTVLPGWNDAAVLDGETGLVWERAPDGDGYHWLDAAYGCRAHATGGRRSWRLPSYEELTSLLDPTQKNPALPAGNPFQGIGDSDIFWTSTLDEGLQTAAWVVQIGNAATWLTAIRDKPSYFFRSWCVRSGSAVTNPPY